MIDYQVKVSIIIPNFNHSDFLEERIKSVFNQSFRDFEVIILDDFSKDESVSLIEQYKNHPKVSHCIYNNKNSGSTFIQWKKGIGLAKGDYIWIAESDDYADITFLEELVSLMDFNPAAGLGYCQSIIVNEKSEEMGPNFHWTDDLDLKRWRSYFVSEGIEEIKKYLAVKNTIPNASGVLIRKSAINVDKIRTDLKKMGDWYLWLDILKNNKLVYSPKELNFFRTTVKSTRILKQREDFICFYEEKIIIINYIIEIIKDGTLALKKEKRSLVDGYLNICSFKRELFPKFYLELVKNDFFYVNYMILNKLNFSRLKKIIVRMAS